MKSYDNNSSGNSSNLAGSAWLISDEGKVTMSLVRPGKGMPVSKPRLDIAGNLACDSAEGKAVKLEDLKLVDMKVLPKGELAVLDNFNAEYKIVARNSGTDETESSIKFYKGGENLIVSKKLFQSDSQMQALLKYCVQTRSWKKHTKIQYLDEKKAIVLVQRVQTGEKVVIKRLSKSRGSSPVQDTMLEIIALQDLTHCRNAIDYQGLYESREEVHVVMEYFNEITLTDLVSQRALKEDRARSIVRQLLEFCADANKIGYAHRDLKLDNILVKKTDKKYDIRVIDFGFAQDMSVPLEKRLHKYCGTAGFTAPEVIRREQHYGKNIDVFAIGCIFYCLLTRKFLFDYTGDWDATLKLNLECKVQPVIEELSKRFSKINELICEIFEKKKAFFKRLFYRKYEQQNRGRPIRNCEGGLRLLRGLGGLPKGKGRR
jgi:serine/threonine protein kinase